MLKTHFILLVWSLKVTSVIHVKAIVSERCTQTSDWLHIHHIHRVSRD